MSAPVPPPVVPSLRSRASSLPPGEPQGSSQGGADVAWHALGPDAVAARLDSDLERGLDPADAALRLDRYGPNALETREGPGWPAVLVRQFRDPLIYVLLAAVALSLTIGELADALAILAIVLLNGALGFVQEWRAGVP